MHFKGTFHWIERLSEEEYILILYKRACLQTKFVEVVVDKILILKIPNFGQLQDLESFNCEKGSPSSVFGKSFN